MTARQAECIVGLLYAALALGTLRLASDGRTIAAVWPANAVLLAAMLDRRPAQWPGLLVAGFLGSVTAGVAVRGLGPGPFLFGLCNLVEASIAARLLQPTLRDGVLLGTPAMVGRFLLVCGLVAPAISGLGGAATAWWLLGQAPWAAFRAWLTCDGLGLLVFTPFLFALLRGDYRRFVADKDWRQRVEALGLLGLTAATAGVVFFLTTRPLLFVLFGPAMLTTFRVGRLGTKISVMVIAVIGSVATLHGDGPIAALVPEPREQAALLQIFLAALLLTCLPVAAALAARGASFASLSRRAEILREREVELAHLAATDALTGALNRAAFRDAAETAMRETGPAPLSLIALDLDFFKQVNDRHGHLAGDRALVHLVSVLRAHLRRPDVIGRVGGDEFLVLLPGTDLDQAGLVAAGLRDAVRRTPLALEDGTTLLLSMSCGTARHEPGMRFDDVVHAADMALYRAKRAGRPGLERLA
ncbi:diguanylate cyclase [Methylobacterium aquaticum]|uniref:diguanylate cyclase n=1 Tax=Methylobacterium aquaticum TaxID=270351 RepID=A0A0J6T382_9HYPH|nr:diguanylate cyclase [Methylobacterium aquaticum]KMO41925.1 hypothetical protein VP06_00405 [Methylobacterium aquaticum]